MTVKVRICPCAVHFPLLDELCFPSWTAKQRLQVLIPKEPHSVQLLVRDLYLDPKLEQRPWVFLVWSVFFLVTFFELVCIVFFSVLTFGLQGGFVQFTMYHLKRLLIPPGCIICALSSRIFGPKCRVSEEHGFRKKEQFPLSYYNLMLIFIPFYPHMFVPPCSLDLFSILTASDMTSWICIIPLLKHHFHLCTDHKNDRWNLKSWLEILIKVSFGRSRIFWVNIFNLSGSYLRSCK